MLINKPGSNDRAAIEAMLARVERSNPRHPAMIAEREADLSELRAMLAACPSAEALAMERQIEAERAAFVQAERSARADDRAEVRSAFRRSPPIL